MGVSGLSPGRTEPTARLKPYKAARRRGRFGQRDPDALAKSLSPTHGHFVGVSRKSPASAHRSAAFVVVLAPLNWLVDNYSGLADCLSSGNLVASLLLALDDLERNSNGTDGVMSRGTPNACGEEGTDDSQKISFGVRGRLSRFRSYPTVRHRHTFTVWDLTSARHWTGHRAKRMKDNSMDKDRIKGAVEQAKGAVKEAAGKVAGDAKLEVEGRNQKAAGKVQNAVGGVKDAMRDALKK
jgi:uncharacterized protein YjbJ (UPF0337 family)